MIPLGKNPNYKEKSWRNQPVTVKQRAKLQEFGIKDIEIDNMTKGEASDKLNELFEEDRQERYSDMYGGLPDDMRDWG